MGLKDAHKTAPWKGTADCLKGHFKLLRVMAIIINHRNLGPLFLNVTGQLESSANALDR